MLAELGILNSLENLQLLLLRFMGARTKGSGGVDVRRNVIEADSFCCGDVKRPQKNGESAAKSIAVRRNKPRLPRKARSNSQQLCGDSAAGFRKRSLPPPNPLANLILPVLVPSQPGSPPGPNSKSDVSRVNTVLSMPHQELPRNVESSTYCVLRPPLSPEGEAPELSHEDRTASSGLSSELIGFQEGICGSDSDSGQSVIKCVSVEEHEGQQQQQRMIHRSVDHLLAQPAPSLDDMFPPPPIGVASYSVATSGIDQRFCLHPHHGKDLMISSNNRPDLSSSRGSGHSNGSSSSGTREVAKEKTTTQTLHRKGNRSHLDSSARQTKNNCADSSPTTCSNDHKQRSSSSRKRSTRRSQSGGVLQPPPTSLVALPARAIRSEPGAVAMFSPAVDSNNLSRTRGATKLDGIGMALVEEAFAFAERVSKEEMEEKERYVTTTQRSSDRERAPLWLLPIGHKVGIARRTKLSVPTAIANGDSKREVGEDWVRGLPVSFSQGSLPMRENKPRQQLQRPRRLQRAAANCETRSSNQTSSSSSLGSSSNPGRCIRNASGEKQSKRDNALAPGKPKWETRTDVDCPQRLGDDRQEEGAVGDERKVPTTAELVERFESGAGVAELRAELEASQASMRRSGQAIEKATGQWRLGRQLPAQTKPRVRKGGAIVMESTVVALRE